MCRAPAPAPPARRSDQGTRRPTPRLGHCLRVSETIPESVSESRSPSPSLGVRLRVSGQNPAPSPGDCSRPLGPRRAAARRLPRPSVGAQLGSQWELGSSVGAQPRAHPRALQWTPSRSLGHYFGVSDIVSEFRRPSRSLSGSFGDCRAVRLGSLRPEAAPSQARGGGRRL